MTEVGTAAVAMDLHPAHAEARIRFRADGAIRDRLPKTRPAAAGIIFLLGAEKPLAAADTPIDPLGLVAMEPTREGRLRALAPAHPVLLRRQLRMPLGIGLCDLVTHRGAPRMIDTSILDPIGTDTRVAIRPERQT